MQSTYRAGEFEMVKGLKQSAALTLAAVGGVAQAAVPAGAEAIFTTAATDFATVIGYGFVAMAAVVGGMIVFNIVRSVAKKSTKT
jgi:hypothetical protein